MPDADGRWPLIEAELIESDFCLGVGPAWGAWFEQALRESIGKGQD